MSKKRNKWVQYVLKYTHAHPNKDNNIEIERNEMKKKKTRNKKQHMKTKLMYKICRNAR